MAEEEVDRRVSYMLGRKKYNRPSGMLWSENSGTLQNGLYVPNGYEVGSDPLDVDDPALLDQFLLITDDNRQTLQFKNERIEKRERMINGRMRSYHIADKLTLSTSWTLIPSRSHDDIPTFNTTSHTQQMVVLVEQICLNGMMSIKDLFGYFLLTTERASLKELKNPIGTYNNTTN